MFNDININKHQNDGDGVVPVSIVNFEFNRKM